MFDCTFHPPAEREAPVGITKAAQSGAGLRDGMEPVLAPGDSAGMPDRDSHLHSRLFTH